MSTTPSAPISASVETKLRAFVASLRDRDSKLRTDRAVAEALEAIIDRHFKLKERSDG